jgi:hypothetical protein
MSLNTSGFSSIVNKVYELYPYMAYGTGEVADNATSLVTEIDRAARAESTAYTTSFESIYAIPSTDGNGEVLLEYGLAEADVGDISSTFVNYPMEKNDSYEILITTRVFFEVL